MFHQCIVWIRRSAYGSPLSLVRFPPIVYLYKNTWFRDNIRHLDRPLYSVRRTIKQQSHIQMSREIICLILSNNARRRMWYTYAESLVSRQYIGNVLPLSHTCTQTDNIASLWMYGYVCIQFIGKLVALLQWYKWLTNSHFSVWPIPPEM